MQSITPFLWFDGEAEEAAKFYVSVFKKSAKTKIISANPMSVTFKLLGQEFIALNGGPDFKFSPATSFFVSCKNQKEVDALWGKLSAGGKKQPCGWLQDKYGLSWQIIPEILGELLSDEDEEKAQRVMQAMLKMKRIEIAKLEAAYRGPARKKRR